ncbi:hypothetical protein SAMN05421868_110169 [Paenibacillus naphthalenovorans]|nr:hypothetical protein SAMN05421868_110169 [Paenibacillus naphthalenovorans]
MFYGMPSFRQPKSVNSRTFTAEGTIPIFRCLNRILPCGKKKPGTSLRLPSDSASRRTPLPSATVGARQPPFGTFTLEMTPMLGVHSKTKGGL